MGPPERLGTTVSATVLGSCDGGGAADFTTVFTEAVVGARMGSRWY